MEPVSYEAFEERDEALVPAVFLWVAAVVTAVAAFRSPLSPFTYGHLFLVVFFALAVVSAVRGVRVRRGLWSDRVTVTPTVLRCLGRAHVRSERPAEVALADVRTVQIATTEPRLIGVTTAVGESVLCTLPRTTDVERLVAAIRAGNPAVKVYDMDNLSDPRRELFPPAGD